MPGLLALIEGDAAERPLPRARARRRPRHERPRVRAADAPRGARAARGARRLAATTSGCWSPTRADGAIAHARFADLPRFLAPGDLLVVNTSATLPGRARRAAGRRRGRAAPLDAAPGRDGRLGRRAAHAATAAVRAAPPSASGSTCPAAARRSCSRRTRAATGSSVARLDLPAAAARVPRAATAGRSATATSPSAGRSTRYQTVFALEPGSAEMPSAGRPFTPELVTQLVAAGVLRRTDHAAHRRVVARARTSARTPSASASRRTTARLVNAVHALGRPRRSRSGRPSSRALETVAAAGRQRCAPATGWTTSSSRPNAGLRAVDGLLTGWHEPESSHLRCSRAVAGDDCSTRSLREPRSAAATAGTSSATAT